MTTLPPRAALYARVSTAGRGQDVNLQVDELRQAAVDRGWAVASIHVDDGVSGSVRGREALEAMLDDVRANRVDVVAVWKLDRLARSLPHLLSIAEVLQEHSTQLVSLRDAYIDTTTPGGRFTLQILGAVAELERSLIQERVQAGVDRAKAAGRHCGRRRVQVDMRAVESMLEAGHGLSAISSALGVSARTIGRRIRAAGLATSTSADRIPDLRRS